MPSDMPLSGDSLPACGVEARVIQADAAPVRHLQLRIKGPQLPRSPILLRALLGRRLLELQAGPQPSQDTSRSLKIQETEGAVMQLRSRLRQPVPLNRPGPAASV